MVKEALIAKNITREGPGLIEQVALHPPGEIALHLLSGGLSEYRFYRYESKVSIISDIANILLSGNLYPKFN